MNMQNVWGNYACGAGAGAGNLMECKRTRVIWFAQKHSVEFQNFRISATGHPQIRARSWATFEHIAAFGRVVVCHSK